MRAWRRKVCEEIYNTQWPRIFRFCNFRCSKSDSKKPESLVIFDFFFARSLQVHNNLAIFGNFEGPKLSENDQVKVHYDNHFNLSFIHWAQCWICTITKLTRYIIAEFALPINFRFAWNYCCILETIFRRDCVILVVKCVPMWNIKFYLIKYKKISAQYNMCVGMGSSMGFFSD